MHAEHFAVLLADEHFADARASFVFSDEASGIGHGELLDAVCDTFLFGRLFGQADTCHFGIRVNHARDSVVTHDVRTSGQVVHDHLAFAAGRMCEHRKARHVACGKDVRYVRAHLVVYFYRAAVQLHA